MKTGKIDMANLPMGELKEELLGQRYDLELYEPTGKIISVIPDTMAEYNLFNEKHFFVEDDICARKDLEKLRK